MQGLSPLPRSSRDRPCSNAGAFFWRAYAGSAGGRARAGAEVIALIRYGERPEPPPPGMVALVDGGQVPMPLAQKFWSPRFDMFTDRFGAGWMVTVAG